MNHQIRVTGVLIKENKLLLVKQSTEPNRSWSLPGGRLELGETLHDGIIREMLEETGLEVSVRRLLYIAEKPESNLVHITFELDHVAGEIRLPSNEFDDNPISDVQFVPITKLSEYGFSDKWQRIVLDGFIDAPTYIGHKNKLGL